MMKNSIAVAIVFAGMLTSCANKPADEIRDTDLMEASRQELASAIEERDRLLRLVKEISTSMDEIKNLEHIMSASSASSGETPASRRRILADITAMKASLSQRRIQLDELEKRLSESSLYNEDLEGIIEMLRRQLNTQAAEINSLYRQLAAANETIDSLNLQIDSLNFTVTTVSDNLDAAQSNASRLEMELNTCFYVVADKNALKKHRIIESGFLRKSRLMNGDFDLGVFKVGDKRDLQIIPTLSSKAKILTNHHPGSFEICDSAGHKVIRILDRDKFWDLSNYLVVQTD